MLNEDQIREGVELGLTAKAQEVERQVLGHSEDGLVGFALVAPDCVVMAYSVSPVPTRDGFFNFILN